MRITTEGWMAVPDRVIDTDANVLLIAGNNESGKSSLLQAVRAAILGKMERVDFQKDAHMLVREGLSKARVAVRIGDFESSVSIPKSTKDHQEIKVNAEVMEIDCWESVDHKRRVALIRALYGEENWYTVKEYVEAAGAKGKALEAMGEWYAAGKSEEMIRQLDEIRMTALRKWEGLTQRKWSENIGAEWKQKPVQGGDPTAYKRLVRLEALLKMGKPIYVDPGVMKELEKEVEEWSQKFSRAKEDIRRWSANVYEGKCAQCGAVTHYELRGTDLTATKEAQDLERAHKTIKAGEDLQAAQEGMAAGMTRLRQMEADSAAHHRITEELIEVGLGGATLDRIKEEIEKTRSRANATLKATITDDEASTKTEEAAKLHQRIMTTRKYLDVLKVQMPEALARKAMEGVNADLAEVAKKITPGRVIELDVGFGLRLGGYPYHPLVSVSGRWRCDLAIKYVMSRKAGNPVVTMDCLDVLLGQPREDVLKWANGVKDMKIVFAGTYKETPKLPESIKVEWIA